MTHIIVGAGQAGGWAAIAMRQAGYYRPYPADRRRDLAALRAAAAVQGGADRRPEPPLPYFHPAERYAEQRIELLLGTEVTELDPAAHSVRLSDGSALDYDRLLLTRRAAGRGICPSTAATRRSICALSRMRG